MAKIWLDWSDGRYSTRALTDEEAAEHEAKGLDVAHVEDSIWEEYLRHCGQDGIWQALWRAVSNEQSMRRRELKLMPLEEAERKIAHLTEELARSQRMETFYEEHYMKTLNENHRETHDEFTCVYPQPGCQIEALREEWREDAQDILDRYRTDRTEDGLKYQGCCCGHQHKLLDDAEQQKLRGAGFLVENDTESYSET